MGGVVLGRGVLGGAVLGRGGIGEGWYWGGVVLGRGCIGWGSIGEGGQWRGGLGEGTTTLTFYPQIFLLLFNNFLMARAQCARDHSQAAANPSINPLRY